MINEFYDLTFPFPQPQTKCIILRINVGDAKFS